MSRTLSVLVVTLGLGGCESTTTTDPTRCTELVEVDASVSTATTWEAGKTYHVPYLGFKVDGELTLEPGVVVKLDPEEKVWVNTGALYAEGTAEAPVVFTSTADDSVGCDVDGAPSTPARGDWLGIVLDEAQGARFDHVEVRYAGGSGLPALDLESDPVSVTSSVFAHNAAIGLDAGDAAEPYELTGNTFFDNQRPFGISGALSVTEEDGNVFHQGDVGNDQNGIFVTQLADAGVNVEGSGAFVDWSETEVPFVMGVGLFRVGLGNVLQLHDGVVVKGVTGTQLQFFSSEQNLRLGSGALFTSLLDDAAGGDTNGDGADTAPAVGDWGGVFDEDFESADPYEGAWVAGDQVRYDEDHAFQNQTGVHTYTFPLPQ